MNTGALKASVMQLRKALFSGLALLMFLVIQQDIFAADAANGQVLYKENCARCHSPNLQVASTGPALFGVFDRVPSRDWLYPWIKNSAAVIATGDEYAVKVYEENNKAQMSAMTHLTDGNIDDILQWIEEWEPPVTVEDENSAIPFNEVDDLSSMRNIVIFLVLIVVGLLGLIALQVARLRGIDLFGGINFDKLNARLFLGFFVLGMIGTVWTSYVFQDYYLLSNSASEHGAEIDNLFWITMAIAFGVFAITNAVLFFFAYRYGKDGGRKAKYYPENNKLEMIWTVVPAIVLTILIIFGIRTWTSVMGSPDDENLLKIEVSGEQWGWTLRYAGPDESLGDLDVRRITGTNILGVDMAQNESQDDFISNDLVLKKGQRVDLKIRSRDVLHSVYLPHFRVKMDAVPGMDTRFHFVPRYTTKEFRDILKENAFWSEVDTIVTREIEKFVVDGPDTTFFTESVIDTIHRYDNFDYELACTEICGRGHFSMRKKVVVLDEQEWDRWFDSIKVHNLQAQIPYDPADEFPGLQEGELASDGAAEEAPVLE